jgi:hypothetical protein
MRIANGIELDAFTLAYVVCALWSSNDESNEQGGEPMDAKYGVDDIAPETLKAMRDDCDRFRAQHSAQVDQAIAIYGDDYAGHDFWLTRNGHGAGFWDGDLPRDLGRALTDAAKAFGEVNLYVGDDGKIYA